MITFFEKTSYFIIFPTSKSFYFFAKSLKIKAEKTFSRNTTIWYVFCSKFATFSDFEVIFRKPIFFSKKTQILNLTISVAIYVLQFGEKRERDGQTSVKKTFALSGRFSSHIMKMVENNKWSKPFNFPLIPHISGFETAVVCHPNCGRPSHHSEFNKIFYTCIFSSIWKWRVQQNFAQKRLIFWDKSDLCILSRSSQNFIITKRMFAKFNFCKKQ